MGKRGAHSNGETRHRARWGIAGALGAVALCAMLAIVVPLAAVKVPTVTTGDDAAPIAMPAPSSAETESAAEGTIPGAASSNGTVGASVSMTYEAREPADSSIVAAPTASTGEEPFSEQPITLDEDVVIQPEQADHVPDTVLVQIGPDETVQQVNDLLARADFVETKDVSDQDLSLGFVEVALVPGTDVALAAYTLEEQPLVQGAQPDYIYYLADDVETPTPSMALSASAGTANAADEDDMETAATINDPSASQQWALEAVNAYEAWDIVTCNNRVTVAVLDSGADVTHPDLAPNIVHTHSFLNSHSDNPTDVSDTLPDNHGTHVAGIVGAVANNGVGVAGVSYNANLMILQVVDWVWSPSKQKMVSSVSSSRATRAITYALERKDRYNIRVINMSFGATVSNADTVFIAKINEATEAGVVCVAAAGNNGGTAKFYPVDYTDDLVGVISLRSDPSASGGSGVARNSTSNYNAAGERYKDIAAPGVSILSTVTADCTLDGMTGSSATGHYANNSGTSMATPLVSGVLALLFTANPDLTSHEAIEVLHATAIDLRTPGFDAQTGYGMVNAAAAVKNAYSFEDGEDALMPGDELDLILPVEGNWTWESSDSNVVSVDQHGHVRAIAPGQATVSAKDGDRMAMRLFTVYQLSLTGDDALYAGDDVSLSFTSNYPGVWEWSSSNPSAATVGFSSGVVHGVGSGDAVITVALADNPAVSCSLSVTVYSAVIAGVGANVLLQQGSAIVQLEDVPPLDEGSTWTWRSGNTGVFRVEILAEGDEGYLPEGRAVRVTFLSEGKATLTVSTADSLGRARSFSKTVTVYDPQVQGPDTVDVGAYAQYTVQTANGNAEWKWTTSDASLLAIDGETAVATGVAAGTVTVQAALASDASITASMDVEVALPPIGGVGSLLVGSTSQLVVDDVPAGVAQWSSSDSGVASVDENGLVTGVSEGAADISVTFVDGDATQTRTRTVRVYAPSLPSVEPRIPGDTLQLSVTTGQPGVWTWSSSAPGVVSVDAATGLITCKAKGRAVIRASLTVNPDVYVEMPVSVYAPSMSGASELLARDSVKLSVSGGPSASASDYAWTSSASAVATVDATGRVTGVGPGTAVITAAYAADQRIAATLKVTVNARPLSATTMTPILVQTYTGKDVCPRVTLTEGDVTLSQGVDYTLEYLNNLAPGIAYVNVMGTGVYAGTLQASFQIQAQPAAFSDVPDDAWYASWVEEAASRGLVTGYSDANGNRTGLFGPDDDVTRGQLATILFRYAASTGIGGASAADAAPSATKTAKNDTPFRDNPDGQYYTLAVNWAYETGVLTGDKDASDRLIGTVRPDDPVTRQEAACMLQRFARVCGASVAGANTTAFNAAIDHDTVAAWARDAFIWTAANDIVSGKVQPDGSRLLDPAAHTTRAETAKMTVALIDSVL